MERTYNLHVFSFDQGPLLHAKRKPTSLGTNMAPAAEILECRGPGMESWTDRSQSLTQSKAWAEWAPGLIAALSYMMESWIEFSHKEGSRALRKLDPSFIEHIKQQHVPYRRDCKYCVQGGAKQRQHRRILSPQMWTLSVDTAGPFAIAQDEVTKKARYFIIGVLTVPKFAAKLPPEAPVPEGPAAPAPEGPEPGCEDEQDHDDDVAELLEAADWLADEEVDIDKDKPPAPKELESSKEAWKHWLELVEGDQESWKKEAETQHLPQSEVVDWVFLEPVATKNTSDVLNAIGRMFAAAKAEGFDVRRIHSDRGREFNNAQLRSWCARHGLHKTYALPEEHQSNGRAEGAIMRAKSKIRTILHAAGSGQEEWPLAARLAAHVMRNCARAKLNMPIAPAIPFNSKVQVLQRSWNRGVWESVTVTAYTKAPPGDSTRGWIVKTGDGKLLTTGAMFPTVQHEQDLEIICKGPPVPVGEPERRLRGKTTLKELQACHRGHVSSEMTGPHEQLAQQYLDQKNFKLDAIMRVIRAASQHIKGFPLSSGWVQKVGISEHQGVVGLASSHQEAPHTSRYLLLALGHHCPTPVASLEIHCGHDMALRNRRQCQQGTQVAVLPLTSGCVLQSRLRHGQEGLQSHVLLSTQGTGGVSSVRARRTCTWWHILQKA